MNSSQRWSLFWGSAMLLLGLCFALKALGIIGDVLGYFWASFLLLAGIWLVVSALIPRRQAEGNTATVDLQQVDLQGAQQASLEFHHGAGQMHISGGAPSHALLLSNRGRGMKISTRREGERLISQIDCAPSFAPFVGPESGVWRFQLNEEIPLTLRVESGASQLELDLSRLQLRYLKLEAGASTIKMVAPACVENALLDIDAGAANLSIHIPEGVAARIRLQEGLTSVKINQQRFPPLEHNIYQSPDYSTASYHVELNLEAGVSSITIS